MSARTASIAMMTAAVVAAGVVGAEAGAASPPHLTGTGHGVWKLQPSNPDTGKLRIVTGRGHFSVGDASIRGTVSSPGFIASGECSVRLRLVTSRGAVTLTGHSKRATPPPTCIGPFRFHFTAAQGTGNLAGTTYQGVGRIGLKDASSTAADHGAFTLTLRRSA